MTPQEKTRLVCGSAYVPGKSYPRELPVELQPWHGYCNDGGHCIVCCLKEDFQPGEDLTIKLVPAPVKTVLRCYEIREGYVVVDIPYSPTLGLMAPPEDNEF